MTTIESNETRQLVNRRRLLGLGVGIGTGLLAIACAPSPTPSPTAAPQPTTAPAPPKPTEAAKPAPTTAPAAPPTAAATAAPAKPKQLDTVTLRMDWVTSGYHAPFHLAVDKGFYAEQGLAVEIRDGQGSGSTTTLVGTDKDMFGLAAATTVIQHIQQGIGVRLTAAMLRTGGVGLTVLKESGITKPQDLKGKRIAAAAGDAMTLQLPAFLAANGMTMADVQLSTAEASVQQNLLLAGRADAIPTAGGTGATIRGATGRETGNLFFAEWGLPQIGHGIIASNKLLAEQSDLVRRFVAATVKGWSYGWENIDEAATILNKRQPEFAKNAAVEVLKDTKALLYSKATQGKPLGLMAPEDIQGTIDLTTGPMASANTKDLPKPAPEKVYTNDFLPK